MRRISDKMVEKFRLILVMSICPAHLISCYFVSLVFFVVIFLSVSESMMQELRQVTTKHTNHTKQHETERHTDRGFNL